MPTVPIVMPQLGESIAEATVVSIAVRAGEEVAADQEIMEVETNKAVMAVTTPCAGTIEEIGATVAHSYPVGATLAQLQANAQEAARVLGETPAASPTPTPAARPAQTPQAAPPQPPEAAEEDKALPHFAPDPKAEAALNRTPNEVEVDPTVQGLPVPANAAGASYISPRMRARMDELGINAADLAGVAGSGSAGRVTVQDFENFLTQLEEQKMTPASSMRIAVADSMRRSWTRPLATVGSPVVLDKLLAHRKSANPKPGPALYAIRALAIALAEDTAPAGRLVGDRIVHPQAVDIGFAVEVPDGVLVPVIRDADQKSLPELTGAYAELVSLARERKLGPEATRPGIATVTNFGTFGIAWATPIPLPEQNLVLGLGAGRKKPVWSNQVEAFVPATEAELTLSFDHRVLDGGGARLLNRIAELLQSPENL